jgi:hypothetical protein
MLLQDRPGRFPRTCQVFLSKLPQVATFIDMILTSPPALEFGLFEKSPKKALKSSHPLAPGRGLGVGFLGPAIKRPNSREQDFTGFFVSL